MSKTLEEVRKGVSENGLHEKSVKTLIVSAFPGCGKTYLYRNQDKLLFNDGSRKIHCSFLDSDSSKFSKHTGWEKEYVDYIISNIGKVDFIFVSQHDKVLEELSSREIPFVIVAPANYGPDDLSSLHIKEQWIGRFMLRDNSHISDFEAWIRNIIENYDNWTSFKSLKKHGPVDIVQLSQNQYLSNKIEELYFEKEHITSYISNYTFDNSAISYDDKGINNSCGTNTDLREELSDLCALFKEYRITRCYVYGSFNKDSTILEIISANPNEELITFLNEHKFKYRFHDKLDRNLDMDADILYSDTRGLHEDIVKW